MRYRVPVRLETSTSCTQYENISPCAYVILFIAGNLVIICHHDTWHGGPVLPAATSSHVPLGIG